MTLIGWIATGIIFAIALVAALWLGRHLNREADPPDDGYSL